MDRSRHQFFTSAGFADHQHHLGMSSDAVYHAHEFVHQRARHNELCAVDLAACHRCSTRVVVLVVAACRLRLILPERTLQQLFVCNVDGECHHAGWYRVRITQQGHGKMDVHVLTGLGARPEFSLESTLLKNAWNHLSGKKDLLFRPIEPGDILTRKLLGRVTIQAYTLVTSSNVSLQVGGDDGVVQLVENAGLKNTPVLRSTRTATSFRTGGFLIFLSRRNHDELCVSTLTIHLMPGSAEPANPTVSSRVGKIRASTRC